MKKQFLNIIFTAVFMLLSLAYAGAQTVKKPLKRPHVKEARDVKPGPQYAWRPAQWVFREGAYVWVIGGWEYKPKGKHWINGYWKRANKGYEWVSGKWG
jgi:hypothetical protein